MRGHGMISPFVYGWIEPDCAQSALDLHARSTKLATNASWRKREGKLDLVVKPVVRAGQWRVLQCGHERAVAPRAAEYAAVVRRLGRAAWGGGADLQRAQMLLAEAAGTQVVPDGGGSGGAAMAGLPAAATGREREAGRDERRMDKARGKTVSSHAL
jgi:hypothetical protein